MAILLWYACADCGAPEESDVECEPSITVAVYIVAISPRHHFGTTTRTGISMLSAPSRVVVTVSVPSCVPLGRVPVRVTRR